MATRRVGIFCENPPANPLCLLCCFAKIPQPNLALDPLSTNASSFLRDAAADLESPAPPSPKLPSAQAPRPTAQRPSRPSRTSTLELRGTNRGRPPLPGGPSVMDRDSEARLFQANAETLKLLLHGSFQGSLIEA
jgi:hypothetical protein